MTQSSFLKSRKHFRKHYIERDSPRIYRRKNHQAFPRKGLTPTERAIDLIRSADPVPLSEIISEIMATLAHEFKRSSRLRGRK